MNHHDIRFELKEVSNSGTFCGYGSVYSTIDQGDDIVMPGAFTKCLAELSIKSQMPAMLWQPRVAEPIGAYTRSLMTNPACMSKDSWPLKPSGGPRPLSSCR